MTRRYGIVEVRPHNVERLESVICDLCGAESDHALWPSEGHTGIETRLGYDVVDDPGWPDEAYHSGHAWDICPACFREKLIPWLKSQGVQIQTEEDDDD